MRIRSLPLLQSRVISLGVLGLRSALLFACATPVAGFVIRSKILKRQNRNVHPVRQVPMLDLDRGSEKSAGLCGKIDLAISGIDANSIAMRLLGSPCPTASMYAHHLLKYRRNADFHLFRPCPNQDRFAGQVCRQRNGKTVSELRASSDLSATSTG